MYGLLVRWFGTMCIYHTISELIFWAQQQLQFGTIYDNNYH